MDNSWVNAMRGLRERFNLFNHKVGTVQHFLADSWGADIAMREPPDGHPLWNELPRWDEKKSDTERLGVAGLGLLIRTQIRFGSDVAIRNLDRLSTNAWDCIANSPASLKLAPQTFGIPFGSFSQNNWAALVHRLAWENSHPSLRTDRRVWAMVERGGRGNFCAYLYEIKEAKKRVAGVPELVEEIAAAFPIPPKWFYLILPSDLGQCSAWAIDFLLEIAFGRMAAIHSATKPPPDLAAEGVGRSLNRSLNSKRASWRP